MAADAIVLERMRECGAVETASSEERPELIPLGGFGFSVAPLSLRLSVYSGLGCNNSLVQPSCCAQ